MNINKYTEKAQEAVAAAQQLTEREGHPEITPEHVLLTLVEQRDGIVPSLLTKMNVDSTELAAAVRAETARLARAHGGAQPSLSARLRQVADAAESEAARLKDEYVSTEHLFVSIASEGARSPSARLLQQRSVTRSTTTFTRIRTDCRSVSTRRRSGAASHRCKWRATCTCRPWLRAPT